MKKLLKIVAISFGVLFIIGAIAAMGEDTSTVEEASTDVVAEENTEKESKEEEAEAAEVKTYQIGDTVETGKLAFQVTNIEVTDEIISNNQFIKSATTSGQFVIIDIEAFNNDSETRMVDSSMFKMTDDKDREFDPTNDSEVMMLVDGAMDFFLQDINPGLSKTGKLVFELPADSTSHSLVVSSGFGWSGGEYETIQLK